MRVHQYRRAALLAALAGAIVGVAVGPSLLHQSAKERGGRATRGSSSGSAHVALPVSFVPNAGQLDTKLVHFSAQGTGYRFAFEAGQLLLSFAKGGKGSTLALHFVGASPGVRLEPRDRLAGKVSFLLGRDPAKWHVGLPTYRELVYRNMWPGIDVLVRGDPGRLTYEFRLRPRADPRRIRLAYRGARTVALTRAGALSIATPVGALIDARPESYEVVGGGRVAVASRYVLGAHRTYGFALAKHDSRRALVIDPGLEYSTYLGGSGFEGVSGVAVEHGDAYLSGCTDSLDFPTTPGAFQPSFSGGLDAYVAKLAKNGSALVYATYLGGSDFTCLDGIAAEGGHAYVIGSAGADFPTTPGAFQRAYAGGEDVVVAKLAKDGASLAYSTYLGGSGDEEGHGIAVEGGRAYVTGNGPANFPTTPGAFQRANAGGVDAFVAEVSKDGSSLVYSTYLGGSGDEEGKGIAVEGGRAYVAGFTGSTDFPATRGAFQPGYGGGPADAFVTELDKTGSALEYSTFLGGSRDDGGNGIAVEGGRAYITGGTFSSDFPTTPGAFMAVAPGGLIDGFVTKLERDGSAATYSTYIGGRLSEPGDPFVGDDEGNAIAVDDGRASVAGATNSLDFPTTPDAFQASFAGGFDAFVTRLAKDGSTLAYSTYLGGTDFDKANAIALEDARSYVAGETNSTDFPTTAGAVQGANKGGDSDGFVTKLETK